MRTISYFIAFLFSVFCINETVAQNDCVFSLENNKEVVHLRPSIVELDYANVHPTELLARPGILLTCQYKNDEGAQQYPKIKSFEFAFIRNGKPYYTGKINSPVLDNNIRDSILAVRQNDSLVIFNIIVSVNYNGKEVAVSDYKNIVVDSIKMRFSSAAKRMTIKDEKCMETLWNNKTFERLADYYGSHLSIDGNFIHAGAKYNRKTKYFNKRFLFKMAEFTNYDFTFEFNERDEIVGVIDNIRKKHLTLKQWEDMMQKK